MRLDPADIQELSWVGLSAKGNHRENEEGERDQREDLPFNHVLSNVFL